MGLPLYLREYAVLVSMVLLSLGVFFWVDPDRAYLRWAVLWMAVLTAIYFCHNILVFILFIAVVCIFFLGKQPHAKVAYFFLLLPAVPSHLCYEIPGFGSSVRYLFVLTYPRLLILFILLPLAIVIKKGVRNSKLSFFSHRLDKYMAAYLLILAFLAFRGQNFTNAFRIIFDYFVDIFIPYYAVSRSVKDIKDIKKIFTAILFSSVILSFAGIFEHFKSWRLFDSMAATSGFKVQSFGTYLLREGLLRSSASMGQPLVFGFFLVISFGILMYFFLQKKPKKSLFVVMGILASALFFTLSRGPWLGLVVLLCVLFFCRPLRMGKILIFLILAGFLISPVLFGSKTVKIVQSVTSKHNVSYSNIEYRKNLFTNSMIVIKRHLYLGSLSYLEESEMQEMKQGEGIVDIVNTYIGVALSSGLVGLIGFVTIFLAAGASLFRKIKNFMRMGEMEYLFMGQVLLSILIAIIVLIGTMSSICLVPMYYWTFLGIIASYVKMSTNYIQAREKQAA